MAWLGAAPGALAQTATPVPVLTWRYDLTHEGQNTSETALTPANVDSNAFGKLFSLPVDDHVFAQPLYVPNLTMSDGKVHNVLFVATENDTVYAFDADTQASPIWQASLLTAAHGAGPGATPVPQADVAPSEDIGPNIGITGTPTIDPATNTMFLVANTKEGGQYFSRLHAINIITGAEQPGSPVNITATVAGNGTGSSGGQLAFDPLWTNQRAGLDYYNGYVYIAYSSHGDDGNYHGWLFAYNAATLQQTAALCLSPNDQGASVWGAGASMPIDTSAGKMFVVTANGDRSTPFKSNSDYGESVLAFTLGNGQLTPTDSWTAFNWQNLNTEDWDQGSGGLLMLPDQTGANPHLIVTAGKDGRITVLNRDNLGGVAPSGATSNTTAVQDFTVSSIPEGQGFWGTAAYWNGNVYMWAGGDNPGTPNVGMAFKLNNGVLGTTPSSETTFTSAFPGPTFSVSSNGTQDGIVWAVKADQFNSNGPAVLYAFDADDLSNILYESDTKSTDSAGPANKFSVPVVTNGKVYVAANGQVDVYGLLTAPPGNGGGTGQFALSGAAINIASAGASGTSTITITPSGGFTGTVAMSCAIATTPFNNVDPPVCSVSQPPAIAGSQAVTATLTLSTSPPSSAAVRHSPFAIGGGSTLAALFLLFVPRRRAWRALLGIFLFGAVLVGVTGCSLFNGKVAGQSQGGTTAGEYTVTVTGASGSMQATTTVDVTIQ